MSSRQPLVPPELTGRGRPQGRLSFGFGPRFFVALLLGFLWLVPAWWSARLIAALILWDVADQFIWATQVKQLKVGSAKRLSNITRKSLVRQLSKILAPDYVTRAREIAPRMSKPTAGVVTAADLLEQTVRVGV